MLQKKKTVIHTLGCSDNWSVMNYSGGHRTYALVKPAHTEGVFYC